VAQYVQKLALDQPAYYRIRVQGVVGESFGDYLGDMAIEVEHGAARPPVTTLSGQVLDQSALIGMLNFLLDRGLTLLLVEYVPQDL